MASHLRDDILVAATPETAEVHPRRSQLAALVPITLAIIGVAIILLGGVSARDVASTVAVDPIATGSIAPAGPNPAIRMLDR
jgi:hypothetical protein